MKTQKGITLIALIITVIVLLILAGAAVSIAINGGDIFTRANDAKTSWNNAVAREETEINQNLALLDSLNTIVQTETTISKETTGEGFVGCYADVDGDGTIDGVIYADLLVEKPESPWAGEEEYSGDGSFALPTDVTAANVKDYVKSESTTTDARFDNTARYVISPASSTTGTKDRFYVMGLDDITDGTNDTLCWYYSARNGSGMTDYETYTSAVFGAGRANTTAMLTKWDAAGYGTKNANPSGYNDLWGYINVKTGQANEGWFVPSRGEWIAFGTAFDIHNEIWDANHENKISDSNYTDFGLSSDYWSSSQGYTRTAWIADLDSGYMTVTEVFSYGFSVRLSTTF